MNVLRDFARQPLLVALALIVALLVVGEGQSWLWDMPTRELLCHWPDFAPQGWHAQRGELVEWSAQQMKILTP